MGVRGNYEPAASRSEGREGEIEDVVKALLLTAEAAEPHTHTIMFEICCSLLFWMFLLFKWPYDSHLHVAAFPVCSSLCICLESLILM